MLKKLFKQPKQKLLPIINLVLIILIIAGGVFYLVKDRKESLASINQQLAQLNKQLTSLKMETVKNIGERVSDLREEVKDLKKQADEIDIRTDYVIDPETGWKVYENTKYWYRIKIPQDWYIYSNPFMDYYLSRVLFSNYSRFYDVPPGLQNKPYIGIYTTVEDAESKNFGEFRQKININPENTIELKNIEINNELAIKRVLKNPVTSQPSVSVHFLHNKKHYSMGYSFYDNEKFNRILEQVINSFEFIK